MRRARPVLEGLEERMVMSATTSGLPVAAESSPAGDFQKFVYTTPQGTHVLLQIVGRGSMEGTTVDSSGALHLLFSKTNAFTKIMSNVHGGTGQAALASIYSKDLFEHDAANSQSGIGATLIGTINLPKFNLLAGGTIDVTSGINILALNSVGPNTQIQLRQIPPSVTAGTTTTTTSDGVTNNVVTGVFQVQTLAGSQGEFTSAGNILAVSVPGNPGPPPAPPGVVIKINQIKGSLQTANGQAVDPQTDVKIFGYDPTKGQVHRFSLNLTTGTGAADDAAFAPITVPGSPANVGLSLGRDGNRLVLLVDTGSQIFVYDATYGTKLGFFTVPAGFNAVGSTDTVTVIGNTTLPSQVQMGGSQMLPAGANQLQMIDVAASLIAGKATPPPDNPSNYTNPPMGFTLLPGLTGLPGSNRVYDLTAALFNSFTPNQPVLGLLTVDTSRATPLATGGLELTHQFSTVSQKAFTQNGTFTAIPDSMDQQLGSAMGSIDNSLAVNTVGTSATNPAMTLNTIRLYGPVSLTRRGTITLYYTNPLSDLSESFRPDLAGTAIVDVQGDIQSFRGLSANGLVLNDTGNLNLLKTGLLTNSTIIGQPITHIQTPLSHRSNVLLITSTPTIPFLSKRHPELRIVPTLQQIGPLSQPNNSPNP
jgi:hypothetical protein